MKKTLLLSAAVVAAFSAFAQTDYLSSDYYVIGDNVNGLSWTLGINDDGTLNEAAQSCKFENKGAGIFEWNGEFLGTGFKINNGTWKNDEINFGSGDKLVLGETYYAVAAGSSGNISFAESDGVNFATLKNPKIVLNVANAPEEITLLVTGEKEGVIKWYVSGTFNNWAINDAAEAVELTDLGGKIYEAKGINFSVNADPELGCGTFKIASTGFATQYGQGDSGIVFGAGIDEGELDEVFGEGGACPIYYEEAMDLKWDGNTNTITFTEAGSDFVNEINAANGEAVYYNLQGARVANPENGLFIQSLNGKATKVLIRK